MLLFRKSIAAAGLITSLLTTGYAWAAAVEVHQFVVMRGLQNNPNSLSVFLNDAFSDTSPPPSTEAQFPSGNAASMAVRGLFGENCAANCTDPGDPDGYTLMDSGNQSLVRASRFLSNGSPIFVNQLIRSQFSGFGTSDTTLTGDRNIHVIGVFRLVDPDLPSGNYGITMTDRTANSVGNDTLNLSVLRRGSTGETFVTLFGFVGTTESGVVTSIASVPIPKAMFTDPSSAFIVLRLRTIANDDRVFADFAYSTTPIDVAVTNLDSLLSFTPVAPTDGVDPTIFDGENFTRARFRQLQVVPEANIAQLTSGSPVTLSREVDTAAAPFNSNPFSLTFGYRFDTTIGDLSVELTCPNEASPIVLTTISAPPVVSEEDFTTAQLPVNNPNCLGETVTLTFVLDDSSLTETATVEIENILGIPNGNFAGGPDGLDGWTVTTEGNASLGVVTLITPVDADIKIKSAKVKHKSKGDEFRIRGTLLFGPSSDGFDPTQEEVSVVVGDYAEIIPAGSFRRDDDDDDDKERLSYKYKGSKGAITKMKIDENGRFSVSGKKVDFGSTDFGSPVPVSILIGNDLGDGEAEFTVKDRKRNRDDDDDD